MIASSRDIDSFRKRLQRAGYYKINIVNLREKGVFLSCFDLYGDFHHLVIKPDDLVYLPKSTISLDME